MREAARRVAEAEMYDRHAVGDEAGEATAQEISDAIRKLPLPAGDTLSTGGWNSDMEKAPRDGTHIICIDGDGSVFRAAWDTEFPGEGFWLSWCGQPVVYPPEPTAWMPLILPEPPPGE